ncbi:hypothetical protein Tco_1511024, partial [Tanacetum coccineum]
ILPEYGGIVKRQYITSSKGKEKAPELSLLDLPTSYKGLMEKTYTLIEAKEVANIGTPNDRQENSKRFKRDSSWDNNKGNKRDMPFSYHGVNHGLLSNLSKSPREILAT